jgi:hypothetical protein
VNRGLLLVALVGCSEYNLGSKPPAETTSTTTTPSTDTTTSPTPGTTPTSPPTTTSPTCAAMTAPSVAVPLNAACDVPPATGTFTPVAEWQLAGYNAYGPPVVGQLDDDNGDGLIDASDTPDIVFLPNNYSGLVAVNGATGAVEWQSFAATDGVSGVAIGDLDADGVPEIVAANGPTTIVAMDNTGAAKWTAYLPYSGLYDFLYPSIADLDGDGIAEVIAGRTILDAWGNQLGTGTLGVGAVPNQSSSSLVEGAVPVAVDLDGDGLLEVVTGNAAYRIDGSVLYSNSLPDGCPAVADFDLDGEPEIVMVSGATVYTLESDLTPTGWSATFAGTNYLGPPAADDLDGDGQPEFVVVGASEMRAYHWDGTLLWTAPVQDQTGAAGPVLFDFEGDGYPEVVYADEQWVRMLNGLDGTIKLLSDDHASYTGFETPIVADVDNDGEVEIAMLHGLGADGLTIFGDASHSWPPGRQVWNQHAYSLTNVNDDLSIPASQAPNWATYNNFRSGDSGRPPSTWDDAQAEIVDECLDECPSKLWLLVRVLNAGSYEIPAGLGVVVRAGPGGPIVASATVPSAIPAEWSSEGVSIEVDVASLGGAEPYVEVDRDGSGGQALTECDEVNNGATPVDSCL